jgi:hypothetical protein
MHCPAVPVPPQIGMYTVKTDHNYWRGYEVFADQHHEHKWVLRMLNEPRDESTD